LLIRPGGPPTECCLAARHPCNPRNPQIKVLLRRDEKRTVVDRCRHSGYTAEDPFAVILRAWYGLRRPARTCVPSAPWLTARRAARREVCVPQEGAIGQVGCASSTPRATTHPTERRVSNSKWGCLAAAEGAPRVGQPGWACGHARQPCTSPWRELGMVVCVSPSHVCRLRAPCLLKYGASV